MSIGKGQPPLQRLTGAVASTVLVALISGCSSSASRSCRSSEGPSQLIRLTHDGAAAPPLRVFGGGSGTVSIVLDGGARIADLSVEPVGPMKLTHGERGATNFFLAVKQPGTTTLTAIDLSGATYSRLVSVSC